MLYFDTSFLTPLIRVEASTPRVEKFVEQLSRDQMATSHWTRVEFSSILGREVRMGRLDPRGAAAVDARFESLISGSFAMLLPTAEDYGLAKRYIGNYATGLRAADALHLAIAANNQAEAIVTLDRGLLAAGTALGLPMSAGIEG
jgi:predicted nucleic acid-binding protein